MSTLKTDTLSNTAGSKSVPMATVVDGSAKAWVNFNGTGTVAIRAAFNVSSITDAGVGQFVVNFTSALPSAVFAAVTSAWSAGLSDGMCGIAGRATGSVTINAANSSGASVDNTEVCVAVFQ